MHRKCSHSFVIDLLDSRGYNTSTIKTSDRDIIDELENYVQDINVEMPRHQVIEYFEFPHLSQSETVNLTELLERPTVVGRLLYYMISLYGANYTFDNLVSDFEAMATYKSDYTFDDWSYIEK